VSLRDALESNCRDSPGQQEDSRKQAAENTEPRGAARRRSVMTAEDKIQVQSFSQREAQWVELCEVCLAACDIQELSKTVLPRAVRLLPGRFIFLYVVDPRLPRPCFYQYGFQPAIAGEVEDQCRVRFSQISGEDEQDRLPESFLLSPGSSTVLYPLRDEARCVGVMGFEKKEATSHHPNTKIRARLVRLVAQAVVGLIERQETQRKLLHLNTYLTVSSMLAECIDLGELLEAATYCSMKAVSAEAASVLLLDDEKKNFLFYQVEGPAKPLLKGETFPADMGIAGAVLREQCPQIINDLENDRRFFERIDSKTGFHSRNMIAVPLVAGEEKVGVLETLNKVNQGVFLEEECHLLVSIAEEIAFAVRNAKIFEYVVESYCKRLQGQSACKGCHRPLGSWTPCQRYRTDKI